MKKIVILMVCGFIVFSSILFAASNQSAVPEENYDEDVYGPEENIFWSKPVASVFFSHKTHTMLDAELSCDDCHDELFEMETGAAESDENFTMAAMGEGRYCGACHDGETAFSYDGQCGFCHIAPEELVVWTKPVVAVEFSHGSHTMEMGLDCEACHDNLFIMKNGSAQEKDDFIMVSLYEGKYCGACHDGETAFASDTRCTVCHIGARGYARLPGSSPQKAEKSDH